MDCITLAIENPAEPGECRVFNQFTEQFNLNELAAIISKVAIKAGHSPEILHLTNPRVELEEHYYNAKHTKLLDLGLIPHLLEDTLIESLFSVISSNIGAIDPVLLEQPSVTWSNGGNEVWQKYAKTSVSSKMEDEIKEIVNRERR